LHGSPATASLLQIDAVLDSLPPAARKAVLPSQLDGLTYAEIACELNVSLATVKRKMLRAFRACLAPAGQRRARPRAR
jgi:DNA-directed RNA polymerase specialized sigma24 family protein